MIDATKLAAAATAEPAQSKVMGFGAFGALLDSVENIQVPVASSAFEPITLERAKEHLRVVSTDEDSYIQDLIVTARQMAEGRLNRTLVRRQITATFRSWDERMTLLKPPVVSIYSVEYLDVDGALQPWTDFALVGGEVSIFPGYAAPALRYRPDAIRVTYTAGYAPGEVPMPIVHWMLMAIATLYANRESIINGVSSAELPGDFFKSLIQPYMVYE